jgi:hypothetical protein
MMPLWANVDDAALGCVGDAPLVEEHPEPLVNVAKTQAKEWFSTDFAKPSVKDSPTQKAWEAADQVRQDLGGGNSLERKLRFRTVIYHC